MQPGADPWGAFCVSSMVLGVMGGKKYTHGPALKKPNLYLIWDDKIHIQERQLLLLCSNNKLQMSGLKRANETQIEETIPVAYFQKEVGLELGR